MNRKTIALDFDGVLHEYSGWNNGELKGPIPGAKEAVEELLRRGFQVVVFSARPPTTVGGWLHLHGFPLELQISQQKPLCVVMCDDRAHRFTGHWPPEEVVEELCNFKAYYLNPA